MFGLRREESLKFQPVFATNGLDDSIRLKSSWCKGGRTRVIPITAGFARIYTAANNLGETQFAHAISVVPVNILMYLPEMLVRCPVLSQLSVLIWITRPADA